MKKYAPAIFIERDGKGWITKYASCGSDCFAYRDKLYGIGTVVMFDTGFKCIQRATFVGKNTFETDDGMPYRMGYGINYGEWADFSIVHPACFDIEKYRAAYREEERKRRAQSVPPATAEWVQILTLMGESLRDWIRDLFTKKK